MAKIQKKSKQQFHFFIFHPKIVHQGATKLSSHRSHRTHRSFWRKVFSHRFRRYAQIRRVWHPCHTHAATKLSSHRNHRIHRSFWRKIFSHGFHGCPQIRRVWHPCHTHATTKLSPHRTLRSLTICEICEIRGRLFYARSFCEFRGRSLRSLTICGHL